MELGDHLQDMDITSTYCRVDIRVKPMSTHKIQPKVEEIRQKEVLKKLDYALQLNIHSWSVPSESPQG